MNTLLKKLSIASCERAEGNRGFSDLSADELELVSGGIIPAGGAENAIEAREIRIRDNRFAALVREERRRMIEALGNGAFPSLGANVGGRRRRR